MKKKRTGECDVHGTAKERVRGERGLENGFNGGEMRNIRVHLLNILRQRGKQFMTPPTQHYRRFHWINVNGCFKRKKPLFVSISHYEVV
jgi:hypothetical protein